MPLSKETQAKLARQARDELARRKGQFMPILPITLSPAQEKFLSDPSKRKVARAGRRSGKSTALAVFFVRGMLNTPNSRFLYAALTREMAREIMAQPLMKLLDGAGVRYEYSKSELKFTLWNGSFLRLVGTDSDSSQNRLLGMAWHAACIDECGYQKSADMLVKRVILPSLTDFNGTLMMISTPPAVQDGLFWDADQGDLKEHFSQHHWDLRSNPFYAGRGEAIFEEVVRTQFGGNFNHPTFLREYRGLWVADSSDRIYPVSNSNIVEVLPPVTAGMESHNYIGIDLGFTDKNAVVVLRTTEDSRNVHELFNWSEAGKSVDEIAGVLRSVIDKFHPELIVADTGGYGKGIVEELRSRYMFPIIAASKTDKGFYQEIVKADLISGYIKFLKGSATVDEMNRLVRSPKTGQEDPRCDNHLCDAFLYIYRKVYERHLKTYTKPKTEEDAIIDGLVSKHTTKDPGDAWWEQQNE